MTLRHAVSGRPAAGDDDLDGYDDFDDFEDDEDVDAIDGEDEIDDDFDFDYDEDDEDEDEDDETFDDPEDDAYYVSLRRGTRPDSGTRAAPVRRTGAAPPS